MKISKNIKIIAIVIVVLLVTMAFVSYAKKNRPVRSILFIGDSNTVAGYSYADQLKQRFPNLSIKKIAMNGAKTDWMLQQLTTELNNNSYDLVAILGGSNNIYALGSDVAAKSNLQTMYQLSQSKGSRVLAVTPPNKDYYVNRTDQKQNALSDLVSWLNWNLTPDYYINFHKITADKSFFSAGDGYLHPGSAAHKILADNVVQKIRFS